MMLQRAGSDPVWAGEAAQREGELGSPQHKDCWMPRVLADISKCGPFLSKTEKIPGAPFLPGLLEDQKPGGCFVRQPASTVNGFDC